MNFLRELEEQGKQHHNSQILWPYVLSTKKKEKGIENFCLWNIGEHIV